MVAMLVNLATEHTRGEGEEYGDMEELGIIEEGLVSTWRRSRRAEEGGDTMAELREEENEKQLCPFVGEGRMKPEEQKGMM
ncbi:UNVERIFIED_CONTAM: hypothetical protein K2H54_062233 [Gekko kuhli]